MTRDELIEKVAKELERSDCADYGWSDEQFDIWWLHDKRNKSHDKQKRRSESVISTIFDALKEPTEQMISDGDDIINYMILKSESIYKAMLNASPLAKEGE